MSRPKPDSDGWIAVHDPGSQHVEFTYPMLQLLYDLPGGCWKTLACMMQYSFEYRKATNQYVRGAAPMSIRFIAGKSGQSPAAVMAAVKDLLHWRLILLDAPGRIAAKGEEREAARYSVNWNLRIRQLPEGTEIEFIDEMFEPGRPTRKKPCVLQNSTQGDPQNDDERDVKQHASVAQSSTVTYYKAAQRSSSNDQREGISSSLPAVSSIAPLAAAAATFNDPWAMLPNGANGANGANGHAPAVATHPPTPAAVPEGDPDKPEATPDTPPAALDAPPLDPAAIWREALADLEMQMTRGTFNSWFKNSWAGPLEGDALTVFVHNDLAVDWLENRLAGLVGRALETVAGRPLAPVFRVAPEAEIARRTAAAGSRPVLWGVG